MSSSPGVGEFVGQRTPKLPEKSSFSQTCSLLSQYLKEKGSFGDLSLGMTCNGEGTGNGTTPEILRQTATTTMNLFPMNEKQGDVSSRNKAAAARTNFRSMDLFPQQAGFAPVQKEEIPNIIDSSVKKTGTVTTSATPGPQNAQLTIFYGGQVIVFNDFPADKAKEVMNLASKGSSQNLTGFSSDPVKTPPVFAPNAAAKAPVESNNSIRRSPNNIPNFGNNLIPKGTQPPPQTINSDLPIARRASLHRFLEKRKDRITSRAPYRMNGFSATPSKSDENKSWLGLAAQSSQ